MQLNVITHRNEIPDCSDPIEFLQTLGGPTLIRLQGSDTTRHRAFTTLLHGNEPSGLQATIKYLQSNLIPAVNTDIIIAAVKTALTEPHFQYRMLPEKRDLNRCFKPPFEGIEGQLAGAILEFIRGSKPECLIDMHNTSGSGPSFAVAIANDADHRALTSLWTNDLIMTDLRLGAIMELSEAEVPTVTIECGGANDKTSLMIAGKGLHRYFQNENVLAVAGNEYGVACYRNPIRMELKRGYSLAYEEVSANRKPDCSNDVTLAADADRLNYGSIPSGEPIVWLGSQGTDALTAKDHRGVERLHDHFIVSGNQLVARRPLKLFMVTTNKTIGQNDCLFYFIDCANC